MGRARITFGFLVVWFIVIAVEHANYSLLGFQTGYHNRWIVAHLVAVVGFSWLIVFLGPTRLEVMKGLRKRYGSAGCGLDRIYLHYNLNKAARIVVVLAVLLCDVLLGGLVPGPSAYGFAGGLLLLLLGVLTRSYILRSRVLARQLGSTEYEARALLEFLVKMGGSGGERFDPPGGIPEQVEAEAAAVPPRGAEYAR